MKLSNVQSSIQRYQHNQVRQSIIMQRQNQGICIRLLQKIDIFSFIPVPKTNSVSTKCSLIGTAIFFSIFLAYIAYDFTMFVINNPPFANTYYQNLGDEHYTYPNIAITFMWGNQLNQSIDLSNIYKYGMKLNIKKKGQSNDIPINLKPCQNVNWIDQETLKFYKNLQCPSPGSNMTISGLLYVSDIAINPAIKISQCLNNQSQPCSDQIANISAGGRVFLFIQRQRSKYDKIMANSSFLIYNFFLVPGVYNRLNVLSQVNKQIFYPDYFNRFQIQQDTRIQVKSVKQLLSDVSYFGSVSGALLLSIQFTLSPNIKVKKIVYLTLIDHIAQWGALWGVLFGVFAILFLAYNKRKFYKKNPKWDRFQQQINNSVLQKNNKIVRTSTKIQKK